MLLEFAGKWDWLPWTGCWLFDFVCAYMVGLDCTDTTLGLTLGLSLLSSTFSHTFFVHGRTSCGLTCPFCTLQRRVVGDFATRIYRTTTRTITINTVIHLITMPS